MLSTLNRKLWVVVACCLLWQQAVAYGQQYDRSYGLPPNTVRAADGQLYPAPGYRWVTPAEGDFRVVWAPGTRHREHPNVVAGPQEGSWRPAPGYRWLNDINGDFRVRWAPGMPHPQYPNILSGDREGSWRPAPGYRWLNDEPGDYRVVPVSQQTRHRNPQPDYQTVNQQDSPNQQDLP